MHSEEVNKVQDVHTIADAVRVANARNVSRGCRRGRRTLARAMMIATGVAGVACLGMAETSIAFGVAAIPLLAATLVLQEKNRPLGR